jgi:type II secretory pathway pseudopilin PulG
MLKSDKIPITVGVVGHLDVITTEEQKLQIENLFKDLADGYPNSPIYLFSSIAEGADRYVANIFLDLKEKNEDYKERFELIVPMPFETEEYKNDFSEASDREFDELLKKAKRSFFVGYDGKEIDRPQQYLKTGKLVADSSLILIALWDGEAGKKGGTADIVKHKITGDDDTVAESTFEYDGTVFILPSSRAKSPYQVSANIRNKEALSLNHILKDPVLKDALEKIEEINSDSLTIDQPEFEKSRSYLFNNPEKLSASQKSILNWYSLMDLLSLQFRKRDIIITICLFALGLFLILAFEIYSNILLKRWVLVIAIIIIVIATLIYSYSRTTKNHKKYLYNRTLAEALRIQFYWNIAGINRNVSDYILRIYRKEFTWVKHILSAVYGITYNAGSISSETIKDLTDNWVKNQADFFDSAIRKMTKQINFYHRISNISFVIAFVLLGSILIFGEFYETRNYMNGLLIIIEIFLGVFALIKAYIQMKGYEPLVNQYELMQVIYQRAESKINEVNDLPIDNSGKQSYLKELFFVIGKEALIENGNWYLIFKEKEPEVEGI